MSHLFYPVIRSHTGDRPYAVGDIREANPSAVAHLVGKCLGKGTKTRPEGAPKKEASEPESLTDISGVGPATAKKLLAAGFDTAAKVAELSSEDLVAVGISAANAKKILEASPGK